MAEQAVSRANETLAPHQQVRRWWLWPEFALPRTGSGKVARRTIETWVIAQAQSETAGADLGAGKSSDPLAALLLSVGAGPGPLDDSARLDEDWDLDSMGRVALAAALEQQTGIAVPESDQAQLRTLGDLRSMLRASTRPAAESTQEQTEVTGNVTAAMSTSVELAETGAGIRAYDWHDAIWPWAWPIRWIRALFIEGILRPLVWLFAGPQVHHAESVNALPRSMLLISNHRTAMDVPLLLYALPGTTRRRVAVAMSGEMLAGWQRSWSLRTLPAELREHRHWWGPFAALLLQALLNVFPLPRTVGFRASFEHAGRALDRGCSVMIFPEGRRGPGGGLLPFKGGFGILAEESLVPILPMSLLIEDEKRKQWRRGDVTIAIGSVTDVIPGAEASETTATLRMRVESLLLQHATRTTD